MDLTHHQCSMEVSPLDVPNDQTHSRYNSSYDTFVKWQITNGFTSFDQDALVAYFADAAKTMDSSTISCTYIGLKYTILRNNNIDISTYCRLNALMKHGIEGKKLKYFTTDEINRFLLEAPDEHYLAMKAILVLAVAGGCRKDDIKNFKIDYLQDYDTEIIVKIPGANDSNTFVIGGEFAKIVKKYMRLRPAKLATDRFFLRYHRGACENQEMGKNKIEIVPKEVAKFLKLDDYKLYNGLSIPSIQGSSAGRRRRYKITEGAFQASTSIYVDLNVNKIIATPQCHEAVPKVSHEKTVEITNFNKQETEVNSDQILPMLPLTTALMKRKSQFYMGLEPDRFLCLLQLARERKELSDVKIMLALRKILLNEDFEVLGDLFDLDKETTERYFHESKHKVIDLVDVLSITAAPTTNNIEIKTEPIIKIEPCDTLYATDPIDPIGGVEPFVENSDDFIMEIKVDHEDAVDHDNSDDHENGDDHENSEDHDDFEFTLQEESNLPHNDRGFLSHELRNKTAQCPACHKFFPPLLLNSHVESVHLNLANYHKTICGLCWKEFATKTMLKAHQKEAHGGCSYGCDVCSKLFSSKRYLTVHILTYHSLVKTYLCDTCGEGFPVQSSLTYHLKRNHTKRGFGCHLCEKSFITAASLKRHFQAVHTNERPYKCEVNGCGKTFGWPSSFASHQRVHAKDKYECPICFKRCSFKGNLRNHLKTMHNEIVENKRLASNVV